MEESLAAPAATTHQFHMTRVKAAETEMEILEIRFPLNFFTECVSSYHDVKWQSQVVFHGVEPL
jgi:hypothetical protein